MEFTENKKTCPGCGRHCELSEPGCERGSVYAETGALPEREHRDHPEDLGAEGGPHHESRRGFRERHGNPGRGFGHGPERPGEENPEENPGRHPEWGNAMEAGEGIGRGPGRDFGHDPEHGRGPGRGHGRRAFPGDGDPAEGGGPRGRHGGERFEIPEDGDGRLAFMLRSVGRMMRVRFDEREGQRRILVMLNDGPLTQRDLTERLGIQPGSASEIVSKLEGGGLITRTPNPRDRRTMDVQLTESGREEAVRAEAERRERRAELFSCLSEEEKSTLTGLLEKLRESWEGTGNGGNPQ